MNDKPTARPGRKRSDDSRMAILTAAFELTAERGYAGLTIEGIATRSGAGKQTIYRWWPSKADVLLDAMATKADLYVPIPDEGSYAADLRKFLADSFALGRDETVVAALRALMAHAQVDTEFGLRWRGEFLQRRRDALLTIVERARVRGETPPGLTPDTVADIVFGTIWYRLLATDRPVSAGLAEELVAAVTRPDTRGAGAIAVR
ncbi:TetR/AcrR family transcriptional regulator [Nocardia sp. alder85J]|uniref:TetR/AcrR family transcriptional regulator n=1 Tax=Nocardia sp. alder85J TaxID=2862949 RepID=UPI001CD6B338|nr:TetR/AcrR family transcriptional regulator [Nocardia sp. alder85J]MCX4091710.1 TetR/AcrR family transcriptional regulator [Nocardia sp. alder85J]